MHIKLTEYTCQTHKKLLKTITAQLTKGSESPCVSFEIYNIPHQSVVQGTQAFWRRKWQPTPRFFLPLSVYGGSWHFQAQSSIAPGSASFVTQPSLCISVSSLTRTPVMRFKTHPNPRGFKLESFILRREWHPTPVILPGEIHGQRSLVSYSPWGHKRVRHN